MNDTILAIETSSETCSVALLSQGGVTHLSSDTPRGHARNVLPMVHELLSAANIETNDIDVIAVTNGPGAFTSIRIGVAVCQGLAAAIKCPVISVSSLAVLAFGAIRDRDTDIALVALDARMNEVYFGAYTLSTAGMPVAIQPDVVMAPGKLSVSWDLAEKQLVTAGIGWSAYANDMSDVFSHFNYERVNLDFPRATDLLDLAVIRHAQGLSHDVRELHPVYLRDQVVQS